MSAIGSGPGFLLVGNGPYANRGCEAIVRGTVELLSERFPASEFVLCSIGKTVAADARSETDHRIVHRPSVAEPDLRLFSLSWCKQVVFRRRSQQPAGRSPYTVAEETLALADCALQSGGDNYTLDYGRPMGHLELDDLMFSAGKPVVLWGASVGPFTSDPEFESIMHRHLGRFSLILARESETATYLASIGVSDNVRMVVDPAFLMKPKRPALAGHLLRLLEQGPIGLNLSPLAGLFWPNGERDWMRVAVECVQALAKSDLPPLLLVPHVTISTSYDNDHAFLLRAMRSAGVRSSRVSVLPPTLSAAEYKWVISQTKAFAGARLHACVAGLSTATPTLSIGYSMKARGINKDIFGHEDWLLPMDQFCPESLVTCICALLDGGADIAQELRAALPRLTAGARSAGDHLADLLGR